MKTILFLTSVTALASAPWASAGQPIADSKESKEVQQTDTGELLFKDHELQLGDFAVYNVGNGPAHAGPFRNHAWGSGTELNYFFTRNIGIGAEYIGFYGLEGPDTDRGRLRDHSVSRDHVGGSLFFRFPMESAHLAPYIYVGGGTDFGDRKWASAHAGAGFEYRFFQNFLPSFVAHRVGFFMDGRFTYLGDRYFPDDDKSRGDLNYFTGRAGLRFTF